MYRSIAVCGLLLSASVNAGEQAFDVTFNAHYRTDRPSSCLDDDNGHGLTGMNAFYGSGKMLLQFGTTTAESATFVLRLQKNRNSGVTLSAAEWNRASNGSVCYYFTHEQTSGAWTYLPPKNAPDTFNQDSFEVHFTLPLDTTGGVERSRPFEFYAACRSCSVGAGSCRVRPPDGHANLKLTGVLKWRSDAAGTLMDCHVDAFATDQSKELGPFTSGRYYPEMQPTPPNCPSLAGSAAGSSECGCGTVSGSSVCRRVCRHAWWPHRRRCSRWR